MKVIGRLDVSAIEKEYDRKGKKATTDAVTWWHAQSVRGAPVSTSQTKQQMQPFVVQIPDGWAGGISIGTPYAKYLVFGAKTKRGRGVLEQVKRWRIGQSPITRWKAKSGKGPGASGTKKRVQPNKNAVLPVALPFIVEATKILKKKFKSA
jgi:hypothetical protein